MTIFTAAEANICSSLTTFDNVWDKIRAVSASGENMIDWFIKGDIMQKNKLHDQLEDAGYIVESSWTWSNEQVWCLHIEW